MSYWGVGVTRTDCPFYIRESELQICCEGEEKNHVCKKEFATKEEKLDYQKHHCFLGCPRCSHAEYMLNLFVKNSDKSFP